MTPKELKQIVKTMRSLGVTHLKTESGQEITLSADAPIKAAKSVAPVPVEISPEEEKEIKHRLEELTSVMKLDDASLLDRLFPDHREQPNEEA